jgi:hypothetical protein
MQSTNSFTLASFEHELPATKVRHLSRAQLSIHFCSLLSSKKSSFHDIQKCDRYAASSYDLYSSYLGKWNPPWEFNFSGCTVYYSTCGLQYEYVALNVQLLRVLRSVQENASFSGRRSAAINPTVSVLVCGSEGSLTLSR